MGSVHLMGAFMCFVLGNVYCHGQSATSLLMAPAFVSYAMVAVRFLISTIGTIALIIRLNRFPSYWPTLTTSFQRSAPPSSPAQRARDSATATSPGRRENR